ncbi:hypothetical protein C8F01DRAFT_1163283 [Mycena amicta]|nr:hypothetical protein C8F01DRAFT_1163283 [Mycena amicta]
MALPWGAQAAHHKGVLARRPQNCPQSCRPTRRPTTPSPTKDIFRLALKEAPSPDFVLSVGTGKRAPWLDGNLPRQPGRILAPAPPRPKHPARGPHQNQPTESSGKMIWVWRASRPPPLPRTRRESAPYVYDYSHMNPAKRKAHKAHHAFVAKRTMLRDRTKARNAEIKWKEEASDATAHLEAAKAGEIARVERRKRWEAQNPVLASAVGEEAACSRGGPNPESKVEHGIDFI